jgi:hypothetical protein
MELTARRKEGEYIADLARSVVCRSLRIRAATATAISLMPVRQQRPEAFADPQIHPHDSAKIPKKDTGPVDLGASRSTSR